MKYLSEVSLTNILAEKLEGKYPSKSKTIGVLGIFLFLRHEFKIIQSEVKIVMPTIEVVHMIVKTLPFHIRSNIICKVLSISVIWK